ncbi:hypothetical protein HYALB_00012601 [Hymenoscyphus albidus]|uniref:RNase H type-1 domain-containing protein n=1 Tax=Hymenoscyphus albidus TaxID=595503 RepID=A0A9N9Q7X1_9HELO|nr:hypothetical protein HYALB_00012601 [Hymenoscyphus albidus]
MESGLLAPEIALVARSKALEARIRRLDPAHPLNRCVNSPSPKARLIYRSYRALSPSEEIDPIQDAPWDRGFNRQARLIEVAGPDPGGDKSSFKAKFLEFLAVVPSTDLVVFTDGSRLDDKSTGGGVCLTRGGAILNTKIFSFGRVLEIYDAEARAALHGLELALDSPFWSSARKCWICLDNLEATLQLTYRSCGTSQETFNKVNELAQLYPGKIQTRWCPSHIGILGNEIADKVVGRVVRLPSPEPSPLLCTATLKREVKETGIALAKKLWGTTLPALYKDLGLYTWSSKPKSLQLPREVLDRLIAARSGHGDFTAYHLRYFHFDSLLELGNCKCKKAKTQFHLLFCKLANNKDPKLLAKAKKNPQLLFGHHCEKLFSLVYFKTEFYTKICL